MIDTLVTFVLRGTLIISVLFVIIELMKKMSTKVYPRMYVWLHALAVFSAVGTGLFPDIWSYIGKQSVRMVTAAGNATVTEDSIETMAVASVHIRGDRLWLWSIAVIWLTGGIVFLGYHVIKYVYLKKKLFIWSHEDGNLYEFCVQNEIAVTKSSEKVHIRVCDMPCSPLLIGYKKPYLYLPNIDMKQSDKRLVILHEMTHLKNHDLYWKLFFMLVCAFNWFNPLILVLGKRIDEDIELACDYAVTHMKNDVNAEEYAEMILAVLKLSGGMKHPLTTCFSKNAQHIKKRFQFVLENSKREKKTTAVIVFLCLMMATQLVIQCDVTANHFEDSYIEIQRNIDGIMNVERLSFNELYYEIQDQQEKVTGKIEVVKEKEKIILYPGECLVLYTALDGTQIPLRKDDIVAIRFNLQTAKGLLVGLSNGTSHETTDKHPYVQCVQKEGDESVIYVTNQSSDKVILK